MTGYLEAEAYLTQVLSARINIKIFPSGFKKLAH